MDANHSQDCEIYKSLAPLRKDPTIGPAVFGFFEWLWHRVKGAGGYTTLVISDVAEQFGVARKTVHGWKKTLEDRDLLEEVKSNEQYGAYYVFVYHPIPGKRECRPDPQLRFEFRNGEFQPEEVAVGFTTPKPHTQGPKPHGDLRQQSPGLASVVETDDDDAFLRGSVVDVVKSLRGEEVYREAVVSWHQLAPQALGPPRDKILELLMSTAAIVAGRPDCQTWAARSIQAAAASGVKDLHREVQRHLANNLPESLRTPGVSSALADLGLLLTDIRPTVEGWIRELSRSGKLVSVGDRPPPVSFPAGSQGRHFPKFAADVARLTPEERASFGVKRLTADMEAEIERLKAAEKAKAPPMAVRGKVSSRADDGSLSSAEGTISQEMAAVPDGDAGDQVAESDATGASPGRALDQSY